MTSAAHIGRLTVTVQALPSKIFLFTAAACDITAFGTGEVGKYSVTDSVSDTDNPRRVILASVVSATVIVSATCTIYFKNLQITSLIKFGNPNSNTALPFHGMSTQHSPYRFFLTY